MTADAFSIAVSKIYFQFDMETRNNFVTKLMYDFLHLAQTFFYPNCQNVDCNLNYLSVFS